MTRGLIRAKIAELLAALPGFAYTNPAGDSAPNVFAARMENIPEERLPAACVYFSGEEIAPEHKKGGGRTLRRNAELVVEIFAMNPSEEALEASLDTLTGAAEAALTVDNTLDGTAKAIDVTGVAYERDSESGDTSIAVAVMTFVVWYESTEGA